MYCKGCKHSKWSHWINGVIGKCVHCDCQQYQGDIHKVNMSIRRQLEEKYHIIRKDKIRKEVEHKEWF